MSWSFSAIGTPAKIVAAIQEESGKLTGQSKVEFDGAAPHLKGLVLENFIPESRGETLLSIAASGFGSANADAQIDRSCTVKIERIYGKLLV